MRCTQILKQRLACGVGLDWRHSGGFMKLNKSATQADLAAFFGRYRLRYVRVRK
jgi:hypothetical protein